MKHGESVARGELNAVYKPGRINRQHQQFAQQHEEGTVHVSGKASKFTREFKYLSWHRTYKSFPILSGFNNRDPGLRLTQPGGPTARLSVFLFTRKRKKIQLLKLCKFY
jgi:hypothetical protein